MRNLDLPRDTVRAVLAGEKSLPRKVGEVGQN